MHQHQQLHQQSSAAVSVPVGNMSRPSKPGSSSDPDNNNDNNNNNNNNNNSNGGVAGASGAGTQGQDACDEGALLALLKRLGLALSPPAEPNESDGVNGKSGSNGNGNGYAHGGNDAERQHQHQHVENRQKQQSGSRSPNGSRRRQGQGVNGSIRKGGGNGSVVGGGGGGSVVYNGTRNGNSNGHGQTPAIGRQETPTFTRQHHHHQQQQHYHHHHHHQQQQQHQQKQHNTSPHNHDPMARPAVGLDHRTKPPNSHHNQGPSGAWTAHNQSPAERIKQRVQLTGGNGAGVAERGGVGGSGVWGGEREERGGSAGGPSAKGPTTAAAAADGMVDLMRCEITAKEAMLLGPILWAAKGVASLKLCYNHLRDGGAEAVSTAIERHPSLHTMDLGFNGIADQGAASLARSLARNRSLKTLYLSGNSIGPKGARALAEALAQNRGLATLHLSGTCIGPEGAAALAEALRSNTSLTRLYIDGAGIKAPGACAVASALVTNGVLSDLHMSDNEIGDAGLEGLAHALRRNRSVKLLELCFNRITAAGAEAFSKSIWGCTSLRALRLDNNQVGDRGAQALASALPTLALETLELGFNNVAAAGVCALMQAVVNSPTFTSLSLSGNALDAESAKAIQATLAQPRCTLRRLFIDHTSLGRASESFIATGVLSNRFLALTTLTGFRLGAAFARLGMPPQVEAFSNDQALEQVRLYWANHGNAVAAATSGGHGAAANHANHGPVPVSGTVRGTGGLASLSQAAAATEAAEAAAARTIQAHARTGEPSHGDATGAGQNQSEPQQQGSGISSSSSNTSGGADNGSLCSGMLLGAQVVAAQNLPPHHAGAAPRPQTTVSRLMAGVNGSRSGAGAGRGIGMAQGRAHDAGGARNGGVFVSGNAGWTHAGGGSGGTVALSPPPTARLKACRVVVDESSLPPAHDGHVAHTTNQDVMDGAAGAPGGIGGIRSHRPLVNTLHEIAQLPFSAAELWSLHQYYFSPAHGQQGCPESPGTPATPTGAGSSTPTSIAAANKIPPIALPPAGAAATAGSGGAGERSSIGTWSGAARLSLGRQSSERTGTSGATTFESAHNRSSSSGRQNGKAFGEGFATRVDGIVGAGGAGARRSRRSSSLGGENDEEDDIDSPRPPSKRYRNSSTKSRIACFPLVQDRIRALKSKPDEHGVLTLLRQLKFLQGNVGTTAGADESAVVPGAAAGTAGTNVVGGGGVPGRLEPRSSILFGPPPEPSRGVERGQGRGGGGALAGSQRAPRGVTRIVLSDHEIERLLLEEL